MATRRDARRDPEAAEAGAGEDQTGCVGGERGLPGRDAVEVTGPVPLGGRFWSAYFLDPFGIRLEFATDRSGAGRSVIESVRQTEAEARAELETLFSDPKEVEKWLRHMPLMEESHA